MRRWTICCLAAVWLLCMTAAGCQAKPVTRNGYALNTIVSVTVYDAGKGEAADAAFDTMLRYEALWSRTTEGSDVACVNVAGAHELVAVEEDTVALLVDSLSYGDLSHGAFTVTIGAVSALWNFATDTAGVPEENALRDALAHVGDEKISVGHNTVEKRDEALAIDLGGIAKGAIADKMADTLRAHGVKSAIINLGGNIYALGGKTETDDFVIGLQSPFDMSVLAAAVHVRDMAVVTSGVYQRSFTQGGVLYHHLLDTATGYPKDSGLSAVTVICPEATRADALSTILFVLGEKEGLALCESLPDAEAVFTRSDGTVVCSSGIGTVIPYTDMAK